MRRRTRSAVSDWSTRLAAILVATVVLAPAAATAQVPVRRQLGAVVPRFIRGHAVESAVIHHVVLVFGDARIAGERPAADNIEIERPATRPQRVIVFSGTLDEIVYGSGSSADDARALLNRLLQERLQKIDRISQLTDPQRQKLELAGRGDLKRLLDRADALRVMCDRYAEITSLDQFQKWTKDLRSEANALQLQLVEGPFDAQSLMAKTMRRTLTADQAARYARFEATPAYQPPRRDRVVLEGAIELRGR